MTWKALAPLFALTLLIACKEGGGGMIDPDSSLPDGATDGGGVDGGVDAGDVDGGSDGGGGVDAATDGATDGGVDGGGGFSGVLPTNRRATAGRSFSAAVDDSARFWTWGDNSNGELGTDTISRTPPFSGEALAPVSADPLAAVSVADVASGSAHILLLDDAGNVWAWGDNDRGQVGNDDAGNDARAPVMVSGPSGVTSVGGGGSISFAIDGEGDLWAWGDNGIGQLGDGTTMDRPTPVEVAAPAGRRFAAVDGADAGNVAVALMDDGTVWSWGAGNPTPTMRDDLVNIVAIAVGSGHTLALDSDGVLWAWGANGSGQLGDGGTTASDTAIEVDTAAFGSPISAIRAGGDSSYALLDDGSLFAWGENGQGELGVDGADRQSPTEITTSVPLVDLAAGDQHTVAVGNDGRFFAWGNNADGKLGDGTGLGRFMPMPTRGPSGARPEAVYASTAEFGFILMDDGDLWKVGRGTRASGGGGESASPQLVTRTAAIDIAMMATSATHTLILDDAGRVWSFGDNFSGQLGTGDTTPSEDPVEVAFADLDAGASIIWVGVHEGMSAALDDTSQLWMWGDNRYGQVGDGTIVNRLLPVRSKGNVDQVDLGDSYAIARDMGGFAWTWGLATSGRGGATPATTCRSNACNPTPVRVCDVGTDVATCSGLNLWLGVVDEVSAGTFTSLVRVGDRVLAFGRNNWGQVGDGTWQGSGGRTIPQFVENEAGTGPLTGITKIWAGHLTMYAMDDTGAMWSWGAGNYSELGIEPSTTPSTCTTGGRCRRQPGPIPGLSGVTISQLQVANRFVYVRDDTTGFVWSWGTNNRGELGHFARDAGGGLGDMSYVPRRMRFLPR